MLNYNEITPKKLIVLDGAPFEVLSSHTAKKNRQKPVNQTRLKNLISGKVMEKSFHQSDTVLEAEIIARPITFIYKNRGEYFFSEKNDPKKRFPIPESIVGDPGRFLKEKNDAEALEFGEEVIGVRLPAKVDLAVKEAPPGVKGNTAQGGTKMVTLETGAVISVPLFIEEGDLVRVNTETGEYTERAK
ncbi:elongation factor P [bacterium]|nr:elongation factor P [bacterium]